MNRWIVLSLLMLAMAACGHEKIVDPRGAASPTPSYALAPVAHAGVAETEQLPAQLAAFQEVSIYPKVNGYVKTVLVDIGSEVQTGQLLMVLEAPELEQASMEAKEKYAQARANFAISKEEYERYKEAAATPGAISPMQLAAAKAKAEADSALSNSEKANWAMQETMSSYLRVTAPFSGVITARNVHPGALVSAESKDSTPMLELKEIDHLRLEVDIPEAMAAGLRSNDSLSFYLNAFPGKEMSGRIARKALNISRQFRSERVELDVYNPQKLLSPGMYATVLFRSKGNPNALSVPKSAVVTSTERKYVIAVRNGKTVRIDVSTGNQSATSIEVFGELTVADRVIANANDEIKEGMSVRN